MSTLNSTYVPLRSGTSLFGSGPESKSLSRLTQQALKPLMEQSHVETVLNDLYDLLSEAKSGQHESELDAPTFSTAKRFLLAFPKTLPSPELALESDGEISFDWEGKNRRMFSVSLRADGRLSYACKLGVNRSSYGIEEFDENVPETIVENVKKIYSNQSYF